MIRYFDASALVKRYVEEVGSSVEEVGSSLVRSLLRNGVHKLSEIEISTIATPR